MITPVTSDAWKASVKWVFLELSAVCAELLHFARRSVKLQRLQGVHHQDVANDQLRPPATHCMDTAVRDASVTGLFACRCEEVDRSSPGHSLTVAAGGIRIDPRAAPPKRAYP